MTLTSQAPQPLQKNSLPQLSNDYLDLCAFCRAGKLFAVQDWFKAHEYYEPERFDFRHWPMGIAIEKGFHSLVEVLLQNGVPANARALWQAVRHRDSEIVELLFQHGATASMVDFRNIVSVGDSDIIRMFISRGADLVTGYPFATGLIRQTRLFLGIYKSTITSHPELQFQADMALRHFCENANLRGVSLLMWLGANPRAKVPAKTDEDEELWEMPLNAAAMTGALDVIKRLKPDHATDNVNYLLRLSIYRRDTGITRYWLSLGADKNHLDSTGHTIHHEVILNLAWALDPRDRPFYGSDIAQTKQFTTEWFSSDAKWELQEGDIKVLRKALSRLSCMEACELIKLFITMQVVSPDDMGAVLDCPQLWCHLDKRKAAIAAYVPKMQKWIKPKAGKRQRSQELAITR